MKHAEVDFHVADLAEHTELDFGKLMRETRLTVDRLLAEGQIQEAESYMEVQRKLLTENGHPIRKLNQAYFAFYGTYAHGPASVDPIGPAGLAAKGTVEGRGRVPCAGRVDNQQ